MRAESATTRAPGPLAGPPRALQRRKAAEVALAGLGVSMILVVAIDPDRGALANGLVLTWTLAAITLTDLDLRVIPNRILLIAALTGLVMAALSDPGSLAGRSSAAALIGAVLLLLALAAPGGFGMGDVKLGAVMGLFLGAAVVPALVVAFLLGSLAGGVLILRHGLEARGRTIPFGPFLAVGGVVGLLGGAQILSWYLSGL